MISNSNYQQEYQQIIPKKLIIQLAENRNNYFLQLFL